MSVSMLPSYSCRYCPSSQVVVDAVFAEAVCRECGLVVSERLASSEAEWREDEGDTHTNPLMCSRARASKCSDYDDGTIFFSGGKRTRQEKALLTRIQSESRSDERMVDKMSDISELTYKLGLGTHIKDKAKAIFEAAYDKGYTRHTGSYTHGGGEVLVATSIYLACRNTNFPRTLKEIEILSGVPMKKIGKMSSKLCDHEENKCAMVPVCVNNVVQSNEVNSNNEEICDENGRSKRQKPNSTVNDAEVITDQKQSGRVVAADLLSRIACQTDFSLEEKSIDMARYACEKIKQFSLMSAASPQCISAAVIVCIALINGNDVKLENVAESASCSTSNLIKAYSQLRPYVKTILPRDYVISEDKDINSLPIDLKGLLDA